jgi:hypothetical protein
LSSQSSTISYFPGFVFPVTLMSRLPPLLIRTGRGSSFELMTRTSPRCVQPAGLAMAALAAAKVRFNFPPG